MNSIKNIKKINKFATKNRAGLNVAMFILTIAALSIASGVPDSPFSSVVSGVVTVVIAVILFRVMVKVAIKK
jgi:hypothetical protein